MERVIVNVEKTPKGFCAGINLLPGWAATVNGDFKKLKKEIEEGIQFYIDCAKEDKEEYPAVFNGEYILEYKFDVESLLSIYGKILTKAALERITGINQKQLSHYACGRSKPRPEQAKKIKEGLHALGEELLSVSV